MGPSFFDTGLASSAPSHVQVLRQGGGGGALRPLRWG